MPIEALVFYAYVGSLTFWTALLIWDWAHQHH